MFNLSQTQKGWLQAFIAIFVFLGVNQITGRFCAVVLQVNPIIYSCVAFSSCALILILNGGKGDLAKETMRSIDTWVYGIILMFSYIIGMLLFSYITATEGTLLQKIGVLLSLLSSWLFLGRIPDKLHILGTIIVTCGVVMVGANINSPDKGTIILLALLYGLFQVIRIFTAELHRPHRKAAQSPDPKARARVIGFVMFVVSTMFLSLTFIVALAQSTQEMPIEYLPTLADFMHPPTIFAGFIVGIVIVAPSRLLEFSSSRIIKAENFTAVTTLSFVSTIFWETISSPITGLSIKEISETDIFAGVLITVGGLVIALTRRFKKDNIKQYLKTDTQNLEHVDDTRNIIANALTHFVNDVDKVSKALEIPKDVVKAIMNDHKKVLTLKDKYFNRVSRLYRKNIAQSDALTGLLNRTGFMTELQKATKTSECLSLLYLDLNKFKPINDTYGHHAGDFALKQVGERLIKLFPNGAVTRLGGDEFCILLKDTNKKSAESRIKEIHQALEQPMKFENNEFSLGTSVGLSSFPEDTKKPELLLELADSSMYKSKDR